LFSIVFTLVTLVFYKDKVVEFIGNIYNNRNKIILPLVFFLLVFLTFYYPFIEALFLKKNFSYPDSKFMFLDLKPSLSDYFLPNQFLSLFLSGFIKNSSPAKIDKVVFFGFTEIILFILFLFSKINKKTKLFITLLILILTIGPHLIYSVLYSYFPFSTTAEIGRYYIFSYLFFTTAIVWFLAKLKNRLSCVALLLILFLLIAERIPSKYYLSDLGFSQTVNDFIKKQKSEGIMIIPDSTWYSKYNLLPVFTDKKLVGGYIHWSSNDAKANRFINDYGNLKRYYLEENIQLQDPRIEQILNTNMINCLKNNNIKLILFDKFYRVYWNEYRQMLARTTLLFPHQSNIKETNKVIKFESPRWSQDKLHYEFYFPKSGDFYLNDIHYSTPLKDKLITLSYKTSEINTDSWTPILNYEWNRWTIRLTPPQPLSIYVEAGSKITFDSNEYAKDDGFLNVWYKFNEAKNSPQVDQTNILEKIYEDPQIEVWKIN